LSPVREDKQPRDLQGLLTPPKDDPSPRGTFERLKERLRNDSFNQLTERAATRTAIELNDLMRTFGVIPNPEAVSSQLSNVARLAHDLESALRKLSGSAVSALLGVEDPVAPYLALPRGSASKKFGNQDNDNFNIAFAPELRVLSLIDAREMSQALATNDGEQLALLARYERALARRREKERWIGPPGRAVLLEPLQERIYALAKLSRAAQEEFKPSGTRRGKLPAMARGAWQIEYAKICWRCIRAEFGDEVAFRLSAAEASDFVEFVRAMAEFASGKKIKTGFGGAVRDALAWGKRLSKSERKAEQFVKGEVPFQPGLVTEAWHIQYRHRCRAPPRAKN
jgi:hypothetical protein